MKMQWDPWVYSVKFCNFIGMNYYYWRIRSEVVLYADSREKLENVYNVITHITVSILTFTNEDTDNRCKSTI